MPDPWLTEEDELHPAAVKMRLPEWPGAADGWIRYRLRHDRQQGVWRVEWRMPSTRKWCHLYGVSPWLTDHEAHALLEKHAREWLRQHDIDVFFYPGCGWNVFKWVPVDALRGHRRAYLLKCGTWEFVTPGERDRIAVFDAEPAAIQAGILAEG